MDKSTYLLGLTVLCVLMLMLLHMHTHEQTLSMTDYVAWTMGWTGLSLGAFFAMVNLYFGLKRGQTPSIHYPSFMALIGTVGLGTAVAMHASDKAAVVGFLMCVMIIYCVVMAYRKSTM